MSATATTLMFAIGLLQKQQRGVFLFGDYDLKCREIAEKLLTTL